MHPALTPVLSPAQVREAHRQLNSSGEVSAQLLGPVLARSWQRSAAAGLSPTARPAGAPHASSAQLRQALEQQRELLAHALPVMNFLHEQTQDSDGMLVLADPDGLLLHSLGDLQFMHRAERVALRPGANWHECWRGTNAVGTALVEAQPLVVHGGEHFLERNAFLTCAAAPIHDSQGRLLGALDLSGDHRGYHRHTLGLVRSAVRMIEHRLFETRHGDQLRLRLHSQPEGLSTLTESLLALSGDGWVTGANKAALALLGQPWQTLGGLPIEQLLEVSMDRLMASAQRAGGAPLRVQTVHGQALWLRIEPGQASLGTPAMVFAAQPAPIALPAPAPADELAALDTGDPTLHAVLARARRVLDKPIALLLQGESGAGKEVLARAVHRSGPRRAQAFVAVNCAALPESLIEAELFGYRPGAFTGASREGAPGRIREADGGVLFLDEIGDMPLAMQGRLLRVLQDRLVVPLGGGKPVAVDIQLICATHHALREQMRTGQFREDLYYRLNGLTLQLPPLRERQDLEALVQRMLQELAPGQDVQLSPELAQRFACYRWPGNLRQLANALRTACALMEPHETQITWAHLPDDLAEDLRACAPLRETAPAAVETAIDLRELAVRTVERALKESDGNLSEAARRLGISRNTLYRKLRAARSS
ncbi:sigma-54-dependent Fis family transcriptional regulator [Ideonella azotifigens]|uniref:Sigma-54-dependent Fis family transcriptional regulator n=2 Tax=Ideonella azotifigens TaxID=513160 RepID=A0ABP3VKY1_9BURK|nr:sigma-54-dependent Fis family transcriptional regulator [Ideonella azotifigens]MCD2343050.1 sigma-54-dependent Fis family transcriptional regulator [Ideonella azotifigens]